jgi:hypothetical protein
VQYYESGIFESASLGGKEFVVLFTFFHIKRKSPRIPNRGFNPSLVFHPFPGQLKRENVAEFGRIINM